MECPKEINKIFKYKTAKETCLKYYNHNLFFQLLFDKGLVEGQYCSRCMRNSWVITDEKKGKKAKCSNEQNVISKIN